VAQKKEYFFFVDNEKYETELPALTGAQIKAKVPNWDPAYGLLLEGHGKDPDTLINDTETVSLEKDKGPLRFTRVPPASFGSFR
jgi:hypothetical protein